MVSGYASSRAKNQLLAPQAANLNRGGVVFLARLTSRRNSRPVPDWLTGIQLGR